MKLITIKRASDTDKCCSTTPTVVVGVEVVTEKPDLGDFLGAPRVPLWVRFTAEKTHIFLWINENIASVILMH